MQTITLYKYTREDGGVTVSPIKPDGAYTEMYRLIADEGKVITQDGINLAACLDTDTLEGWYEIDEPTEDPDKPLPGDEISDSEALAIITGGAV